MVRPIEFPNCRIGFKNFKGEKGTYNKKGDRNFVVFIEDPEFAQLLDSEGWNVKYPKPLPDLDPEEDTRQPYLPIKVSFDNVPPKVVLIRESASGQQTTQNLEEDTIGLLDDMQFDLIDLFVRPYAYDVNGNTGISAYCSQLYLTARSVGFESKYGF